MGYQLKDVCYSSEAMAQDAYVQSIQPAFVINSTTSVFFYPEKVSGSWCMGAHDLSTGALAQCPAITIPPLTSCIDHSDPTSQFTTGMELGGAVSGVIVIAFLWRYLRVRH